MQPIKELSELKQAEWLKIIVSQGWPLETADREVLAKILKEWIEILREEQ